MCHCTPCSNQPAASQGFSQWRVHPELEGSSLLEHLRIAGYVTAGRPARALQRALAVQKVATYFTSNRGAPR